MGSSRHYICEFRGRCPQFDKNNTTCLETPWICRNWQMHITNQKAGKKPITNAQDFKITDYVGNPEKRFDLPEYPNELSYEDISKEIVDPILPKQNIKKSKEVKRRKRRTSPYFKGQLVKKADKKG